MQSELDREGLHFCIDPLDERESYWNWKDRTKRSGCVQGVNIECVVMQSYEESVSEGFNAILSEKVMTMAVTLNVMKGEPLKYVTDI